MSDDTGKLPKGKGLEIHEEAMQIVDEANKYEKKKQYGDACISLALAAVGEFRVYQMIPATRPKTRAIIESSYKNLLIRAWDLGNKSDENEDSRSTIVAV